MAGILVVALVIVSFLIPNRMNNAPGPMPDEVNYEQQDGRPSVQAMPIHKVAERASFNVVAAAR